MLELNRNAGHKFWKVKRCEDTKGANVEAQIKEAHQIHTMGKEGKDNGEFIRFRSMDVWYVPKATRGDNVGVRKVGLEIT
mmetsp:Transcript_28471/g.52566  ORF Transcript_28471/g.52566 Transcript_28471/m.52566 type:complete len:80 (+) Transcript_28471:721-960(+)